jgi:hypothetical protein
VPASDHDAARAIAAQIHQARPNWLVLWGLYSRRFWAFALFEMQPQMLVHASYPDALIACMDDAERCYRIQPEQVTHDDTNTR